MGWAIDTFGQADSMATASARVLTAIGASRPAAWWDPENLTAGMLVVIPAMLAPAGVMAGARHLPADNR